MNKEEYIVYVKEYKTKLRALVRLQRYLKRYLRKAVYPDPKFILSEEEIRETVKAHLPRWEKDYWGKDSVPELFATNNKSSHQWRVWMLKGVLREMQEDRVFRKQIFKEEVEKVA